MLYVGTGISLICIVAAGALILRKFSATGVLLLFGLLMLSISVLLGISETAESKANAFFIFEVFSKIQEVFSEKGAGVGLMIMAIGGYVAYMDKIGASAALVYLAMKPLSILEGRPYLAASLVIPLGHLLSIPIPSATGLGLLLIASVFPLLLKLGVSRVAAVSVIVSTTVFDMGPASANTLLAAELANKSNMHYFLEDQLSMGIPLVLGMMVLYYFTNRFFDANKSVDEPAAEVEDMEKAPHVFAILPVLPLVLLLVFSEYFAWFESIVELSTTTAMFISTGVATFFVWVQTRDARYSLSTLHTFWMAMGKVFASVIVLIVAAQLFSEGLISLGFVDSLVELAQTMGLQAWGLTILMTVLIFLASMLMGSGNASFFSFGPLVPGIASKLGADSAQIILPMQFSSSLGRAVSPIAGVVIATAEIAQVSPLDIVKRNLIPVGITLLFMLLLSF